VVKTKEHVRFAETLRQTLQGFERAKDWTDLIRSLQVCCVDRWLRSCYR
jgi:hypothetical protein